MINQNCENFNCILHKKCPFYEACECDEIKCNYEYDCENCEHPAQCDKESEVEGE